MLMKLPDSGPWLSSTLSSLGRSPGAAADHTAIEDVSETQLNEALDALAHGDIEFVILENGDDFLQVAGSDEGPYHVERHLPGSEDLAEIAGGVNQKTMREAMLAYRRGDLTWTTSHRWNKVG